MTRSEDLVPRSDCSLSHYYFKLHSPAYIQSYAPKTLSEIFHDDYLGWQAMLSVRSRFKYRRENDNSKGRYLSYELRVISS